MIQKLLFGLIFVFLGWGTLWAQTNNQQSISTKGLPLIKNHTLEDYPTLFHNYQITQDTQGILFIANDNGLIEFDGLNWRQYQLPEQIAIKAVAFHNKRIYVAGNSELGFFEPDKQGHLGFISLAKQIKQFKFPLPVFTKIVTTPTQVIFFSTNALYLYNVVSKKIKYLPAKSRFYNLFKIKQQVFVQEANKGLFRLEKDKLSFVQGSDIFADKKIRCILTHPNKQLLIGTQDHGFYLYNGQLFSSWDVGINNPMKEAQLYTGISLSDNYFAFGTFNQGLILSDQQGKLIKKIDKGSGLPSNIIYSLFLDRQKRLWLGMPQGISQVDIFSPLSTYNEKLGLEGIVYDAIQVKGNLFLGTSQGIFTLDSNSQSGRFTKVPNTNGSSWDLEKVSDQILLATHSKGIYTLLNNKASLSPHNGHMFRVAPLPTTSNTWLICAEEGLYAAKFGQNESLDYYKVKGAKINFTPFSYLVSDASGFVWTSNANNGVIKMKLNAKADSLLSIRFYGKADGLPSSVNNRVFSINKQLVVGTKQGAYQYNPTTDKFEPHHLTRWLSNKPPILWMSEDKQQNIWVLSDRDIIILEKAGKKNEYRKRILFHDIVKIKQSPFIYFTNTQNVLLNVREGLLSYDLQYPTRQDSSFSALIRLVEWERAAGKDSVLIGGGYHDKTTNPVYAYEINDFRFTVAANYLPFNQLNQFQFFLEGYDKEWSGWTTNQSKEYTNLPPGNYIFKVKARNSEGVIGKIAQFTFTIRTPWYLTRWMNIVILLLIALLFVGFFWWNSRRLTLEKERLETLVKERTEEITMQRDKVQASFQQLEEQRGDLIYKNVKLERQQEVIMAQSESLQETLDELQSEKKEKEEALKLVEERNRYYTSGIRYAQTIQRAILADENAMKTVLKDYFVLYSPKDIVSGDFYWFSHISENVYEQITGEKNKSITFIAVIDCTGHGVPGAFMSMIGNTLLNEIVNQRHFFDPVRVLEMLNIKIRVSLKQEEKYNADGMDVCFCRLEKLQDGKQTLVSFTGARRPLYYKVSQDSPLKELKGDRKVIGGWQRKKRVFTSQEILLEEGGALYLTTDGLVGLSDPNGKKFSSLRMKAFFDENAHLPMEEQKAILLEQISEHQQQIEQRDDMTILGIRV